MPRPVVEFYDAASACLGETGANLVMGCLLRYPEDDTSSTPDYFVVSQNAMRRVQEDFEIPDLFQRNGLTCGVMPAWRRAEYLSRVRLSNRIARRIREVELATLGSRNGVTWAIEADYRIHEQACGQARRLADQMRCGHRNQTLPSHGSIEGGVDMKATIASMARGQPRIHIRRRRSGDSPSGAFDFGTPVAFLFRTDLEGHAGNMVHDSNPVQRQIERGERGWRSKDGAQTDFVNSVFMTSVERVSTCSGHLELRELSSLILLYTKFMGVQRYNAITARPEKYHCRQVLGAEPELRHFAESHKGIAWAIKYAEHTVIVVAPSGWQTPDSIEAYARQRNVQLLVLRLSDFAPDFIKRMQTMHFITTPLKKHRGRDEIVRRFLP
jgi:hypothetical protein